MKAAACLLAAAPILAAAPPLQVARPMPVDLDLRTSAEAGLIPADPRDPAQQEASRRAWAPRVEALAQAPSVRLLLPDGPQRLPLLLGASQALRAARPDRAILVAFQPGAQPLWDEAAWGAVDGGALLPGDLGTDPETWRSRLAEAQAQFPGRPWFLWLDQDPGPRLGVLLGDGGRAVVPLGGPSSRLAAVLPAGLDEVEGGHGDLTLAGSGGRRRWRFEGGDWRPADLPKERNEVRVEAQAAYDVGALLAKMRAAQLRDRTALRTVEARLTVDLHLQATQGTGADLGFTFQSFEAAGETEELLQQEVRFNGMKAKLTGEVQLPIVEARTSMAAPVALSLTERFRYRDGGPGEGPGIRLLRFEPVDGDPALPAGELEVEEATGRIRAERSHRSELPGMVKSERRILRYGEPAPGNWRVVEATTFERWVTSGGVSQVQRRLVYDGFRVNEAGFEARRSGARASKATMLKQTVDGLRYFTRQDDGSRAVEAKPRASGRALGGLLLVDPGLDLPVMPLGGLAYFNFNAFDRGIQVNALTAVVFNQGSLAIPNVGAGFDLGLRGSALLLPVTERPVRNGGLAPRDGVARRFGALAATLGRDLGLGFRLEAEARFRYDRFSEPREDKYTTPGFALPPSGWTREVSGELSWQARGFQLHGSQAWGRRPAGTYGTVDDPQAVPDGGRFRQWGLRAGYDHRIGAFGWLHSEVGAAGGEGFDRFTALGLGGLGGTVRVPGLRSGAMAADRVAYAKAGVVLPSGPRLRLTLTLDHARARSLQDGETYGFTGLGAAGDLPGFWVFTALRVDLGVGLQSDIPGLRTVNGFVALLRVF